MLISFRFLGEKRRGNPYRYEVTPLGLGTGGWAPRDQSGTKGTTLLLC